MADDLFGAPPEPEMQSFEPKAPVYELTDKLVPPREMVDCLGHQKIEQQILSFYEEGRMPHAMIFAGQKGIGKATMAYRIARFLLKHGGKAGGDQDGGMFGDALPTEKIETLDVSLEDQIFRQVISGGHSDFLTIERPFDEKKNRYKDNVPVDEVRKVTPFLRMTASQGGWRVVIIDDADTMNRNAQNAVLKILEEPPANTVLILVTHRSGAMVPTIRSRCRTLTFDNLEFDNFATLLKRSGEELSNFDIEALYNIAGGSVGRALNIAHEGGLEAITSILGLLQSYPKWDWPQIHSLAEKLGTVKQLDSYKAFRDVFIWINEAVLRSKATNQNLPAILSNDTLLRLKEQYDLAEWIEICDNLKEHFIAIERSNLDKKQAILGAFTMYEKKKAA